MLGFQAVKLHDTLRWGGILQVATDLEPIFSKGTLIDATPSITICSRGFVVAFDGWMCSPDPIYFPFEFHTGTGVMRLQNPQQFVLGPLGRAKRTVTI